MRLPPTIPGRAACSPPSRVSEFYRKGCQEKTSATTNFTAENLGACIDSGVILGNDKNFYGIAAFGGKGCVFGCGTVFKITPAGVPTTLHFPGRLGRDWIRLWSDSRLVPLIANAARSGVLGVWVASLVAPYVAATVSRLSPAVLAYRRQGAENGLCKPGRLD